MSSYFPDDRLYEHLSFPDALFKCTNPDSTYRFRLKSRRNAQKVSDDFQKIDFRRLDYVLQERFYEISTLVGRHRLVECSKHTACLKTTIFKAPNVIVVNNLECLQPSYWNWNLQSKFDENAVIKVMHLFKSNGIPMLGNIVDTSCASVLQITDQEEWPTTCMPSIVQSIVTFSSIPAFTKLYKTMPIVRSLFVTNFTYEKGWLSMFDNQPPKMKLLSLFSSPSITIDFNGLRELFLKIGNDVKIVVDDGFYRRNIGSFFYDIVSDNNKPIQRKRKHRDD
uniref:Uncharacterized protein n=1 Tax=Panagrolaimus sp. JU765 TaxID=591449 RepID=A0AC34RHF7_9BILA